MAILEKLPFSQADLPELEPVIDIPETQVLFSDITATIAKHGDALENLPYFSVTTAESSIYGVLAATGAAGAFDAATDQAYPHASTAVAAGTLAGTVGFVVAKNMRMERRSKHILKMQDELSQSLDERIEFFNHNGPLYASGNITMRWYGSYEQQTIDRAPLNERFSELARLVAADESITNFAMPSGIATRLGLPSELRTPEQKWQSNSIRNTTRAGERPFDVVTIDRETVLTLWDEIEAELPPRDDELLQQALQIATESRPNSKLALLVRAADGEYDANRVDQLVPSLARIVNRELDDVSVKRDSDGNKIKQYRHGMLNIPENAHGELSVRWLSNGRYDESDNLWGYLDSDSQSQLLTMLESAKPRERELAAALVALSEIQRLRQQQQPIHQQGPDEWQPPMQANRVSAFFGSSKDQSIEHPARVNKIGRQYQRTILRAVGIGALAFAASHGVQAWQEGSLINSQAIATVDETIGNVAERVYDVLPDMNGDEDGDALAVAGSSQEAGVGNVGDGPNRLEWQLTPINGATTEGYWVQEVHNRLTFFNDRPAWAPEGDFAIQEQLLDTNLLYSEAAPLIRISGQAEYSDLPSSSLGDPTQMTTAIDIPVLLDHYVVEAHITLGDEQIPAAVYRRPSGTYYVNMYQTLAGRNIGDGDDIPLEYTITPNVGMKYGNEVISNSSVHIDYGSSIQNIDNSAPGELFGPAGLPETDSEAVYDLMKGKEYGLKPLKKKEFEGPEQLLDAIVNADTSNCNTANTAYVLSAPASLNLASGFYNANYGGSIEGLSSREAHAFAVSTDGRITDATPPGNGEDSSYLKEDFKVQNDGQSSNTPAIPIQQAALVLSGLASIGVTAALRKRQQQSSMRETLESATEETLTQAYDLINHTLYAPEDAALIYSSARTHEDITTSLGSLDLSTKGNKALVKSVSARAKQLGVDDDTREAAKALIKSLR